MMRRTRFLWILGLILLAGVVHRAMLFADCRNWIVLRAPVLDAGFYHGTAAALVNGGWPANEPYFMGPMLSYLLGGLYALFGANVDVARIFQMGIGIAGLALLALVGRRLFGERAGLFAAGLGVLYGPFVFYEQVPLMAITLTVGALALFDRALAFREGRRIRDAVLAGLLIGGLTALRGTAVLYLIPALWVMGRAPRPAMIAMAVAVLAVIAPFTIHNVRTGSRAVLTTSGGWNLYIGNQPESRGMFRYPNGWRGASDFTGRGSPSAQIGRPLDADETDRFWRDRAFESLRENPGRALSLGVRKLYLFVQGEEIPQNENYRFFVTNVPLARLAAVGWWLALPLGLLGLLAVGRVRGAPGFTIGFVLVPLVTCIIFFVTSRYRLPAVPFLLLLAGGGLSTLLGEGSAQAVRRVRRASIMVPILAAGLLLLPSPFNSRAAIAREYANVGLRYQQQGAFRAAEEQLRRAIAMNPTDGDAHNNLGAVLIGLDRTDEAIETYQRTIQLIPENPVPYRNLAAVFGRAGRDAEAEATFRRAHEIDPTDVETLINLGTSQALQSRLEEAIETYEAALRLDPGHVTARDMLLSARQLQEAIDEGKPAGVGKAERLDDGPDAESR